MEGWVGLGYPAMHRPGVELAISRSQVRRPNHYTTEQPDNHITIQYFKICATYLFRCFFRTPLLYMPTAQREVILSEFVRRWSAAVWIHSWTGRTTQASTGTIPFPNLAASIARFTSVLITCSRPETTQPSTARYWHDATRRLSCVGVGGVYWAWRLYPSSVCSVSVMVSVRFRS